MPGLVTLLPGRRVALLGLAAMALALGLGGPVLADRGRGHGEDDDDHDHDLAHEALEHGEVKPLVEILARVRPELPAGSEILDVDFARKGEAWLYRFKVIDGAGNRLEVLVDAATGDIVETRQH